MGPNYWKFLEIFSSGRDCPEHLWAVWVFNFGNLAFKICMLDMRKCREWVVDRSQNMGPNCGDFLDILG